MSIAVRRTAATVPSNLDSSSSSSGDLSAAQSSSSSNDDNGKKQQSSSPQHAKSPQSSAAKNNNTQSSLSPKQSTSSINNTKKSTRRLLPSLSPRTRSVLFMSLSLAIHLGGYELSRATVMALFTSDGLGFGHSSSSSDNSNTKESHEDGGLSALPMAVGCVSPFSAALLWFYAKTLSSGGPSYALRTHALICAGMQIVSGWALSAFDSYLHNNINGTTTNVSSLLGNNSYWSTTKIKAYTNPLLFFLFVFQNAYVQLLYNQHWAFISSILTPEEGKRAFAPIAGLGSIGSTLAAACVSLLVDRVGLIGLLHLAGVSYVVSAVLADVAFGVARVGGFEPGGGGGTVGKNDKKKFGGKDSNHEDLSGDEKENNCVTVSSAKVSGKGAYTPLKTTKDSPSSSPKPSIINNNKKSIPCCKEGHIFQQAHALFRRVPVLGALFLEVIVSQCLSSLVNFIYLYKLKSTITDDAMRAGWAGNFYAWINGVSGVFQFFIIPLLLKHVEAHRIWLFMPTLMLCCTTFTFATFRTSGLLGASASFFAIKTMEYSLRGAANEMLYVSLDYESRYLGKKVISLIAGKFGKSAMAVALSFVMVVYGDKVDMMWYLLVTAMVFTFLWLFMSISLHSLIEASR